MNEDEIRNLLHEMNDDPVPADALRRVRLGVAARTRSRTWMNRSRTWMKMWSAAAIAAAACATVLLLWLREPVPISQSATPVAVLKPTPPPLVTAPLPIPPTRRNRTSTRAAVQPAIEKTRPAESNLVIRIETSDPDVLILLIGD